MSGHDHYFDPTRVAVVDQSTNVTLVRGNMPLYSQSKPYFAYNELKAALAQTLDLDSVNLLVISLIDNVGEAYAFTPEITAFGADTAKYPPSVWPPYVNFPNWNPPIPIGNGTLVSVPESVSRQGQIDWWPIEGFPAGTPPATYLGSPCWNFSGLVSLIQSLMGSPNKQVIYFHCMNGADRTGSVHGGYLMKVKGMTYAQALAVVTAATSAGAPSVYYQNLMQAYSETL